MKFLRLVAIILFFVLVAVVATHSLNSINQDIGRHLKSGQIIWETGSVYKINLFSFTEPDQPFINHHWLSEVVFYLLNGLIGLKGLIIFKATAIVVAFWLIFQSVRKGVGIIPFLFAGTFGILVFSSRSDVRPEVFSYLFLSYFLFAIFRAKYDSETKWFYALPIIQIFWTNTHIYFALGPLLLLLFLIDRLVHDSTPVLAKSQRSQRASLFTKMPFVIFILTSLATLVNPNFIRGALAPLTILRNYGYSIVENQNIFFLTDYGVQLKDIYLFEISLIVLIISFIFAFRNGRKNIAFEFLTAVIFTILAGKMIRNLGIYALVFVPIVASNLSAIKPTRNYALAISIDRYFSKLTMPILLGFIILFSWLIKSTINNSLYQWLGTPKKFGLGIPDGAAGAVRFIQENRIAGPVFNNFDVGSFLIWRLFPAPQEEECPKQLAGHAPHLFGAAKRCGVFVDGRPEAYSVEFFEKIYRPMQENPAVWEQRSKEYGINYVFFGHTDITPWARTFLGFISKDKNWPLVYLDSSTAIFIKRVPENRELIQKFEIKWSPTGKPVVPF